MRGSTVTSRAVPESSIQSRPWWSLGECGIDRPWATIALLGTSIRQPPCALTGPPALGRVGLAQRRHIPRPALLEDHAIEMAPVLGRHRRDEARLPVRQEAQMGMERAEAGKEGVHEPELLSGEGHLVRVDLGRDVGRAGDVATVELARGLDPARQRGHALQEPDLRASADRDAIRSDGQPHGPFIAVQRHEERPFRDPHRGDATRLVGRDQQRAPDLTQDLDQVVGVLVRAGDREFLARLSRNSRHRRNSWRVPVLNDGIEPGCRGGTERQSHSAEDDRRGHARRPRRKPSIVTVCAPSWFKSTT